MSRRESNVLIFKPKSKSPCPNKPLSTPQKRNLDQAVNKISPPITFRWVMGGEYDYENIVKTLVLIKNVGSFHSYGHD